MIRHISFDLWLTLIRSNPIFKQIRAEYLAENYNPKGEPTQSVFKVIQGIDRATDRMNELSGRKLPAEQMYASILQRLGYEEDELSKAFLSELILQINELFLKYPPIMLNENIRGMLSQLTDEGYSLNISSNTGFIEGPFMRNILTVIDLNRYFDFAVYSDEIGASKPSPIFFEHVYKNIKFDKSEIIHIGDNYNADYIGAKQYGFQAILVEDCNYSFDFIKSRIDEKDRGV